MTASLRDHAKDLPRHSLYSTMRLPAVILLTLLGGCAGDETAGPGTIDIRAAHVAAPAGDGPTAMYLTIHNRTPADIALIAAETGVAMSTELHTQMVEDGRMRMNRLDAIPLAAGEAMHMAPGGLHVMLMELQQTLTPGDSIEVVLHFDSGDRIATRAAVLSYGELAGVYEASGEQYRQEGS